jgi:hypothetical protein
MSSVHDPDMLDAMAERVAYGMHMLARAKLLFERDERIDLLTLLPYEHDESPDRPAHEECELRREDEDR